MSIDPRAPRPKRRTPAHRAARRATRLPRAAVVGAMLLAVGGTVATVAALPAPAGGTAPGTAAAAADIAAAGTTPTPVHTKASSAATAAPTGPAAPTTEPAGASPQPASPSAAKPSSTRTGGPGTAATTPAAAAATTAASTPAAPATPASSAPAAKTDGAAAGAAGAAGGGDEVQQVLALINDARAAQGLPPYTLTAGLTAAAAGHNDVMSGGCGLAHQCPGEPAVGKRESAQGVHWGTAGENIGRGGPVSTATADIAAQAVRLTQSMLDEKPPEDGHRRNLLSRSFTHIGISVYRDSAGTVWLTQDFSD
ncbi:CAP domain-containing protein [Kitasatospora sp. NPDC090091]|uniref:CAP domain-containing protein n=1 Tax=Kitasatospora sp. NPDC090091 TaxID=3364081 RepID=UPI00380DF014